MSGELTGQTPINERSQTSEDLSQELSRKYPEAYSIFEERLTLFGQVLEKYGDEIRNDWTQNGRPSIIPTDNPHQVFESITHQFGSFVLRTREESIRKAENASYSSEESRQTAIALAMGGWNGPKPGRYMGDILTTLAEKIDREVRNYGKGYERWQQELYEVPSNTEAIKSLASFSKEDRSIRAVGFLLATLIHPGWSASIGNLAKRDFPKYDVITVDGNPADVATNILVNAGAKPYDQIAKG